MRSSPALIVAAIFIAEASVTFESAMIYGALPTLIRQYGNPITAGWLVTAHLLVAAGAYAVVGRLGDIRGRKGMMLTLMSLSLLGSLISASSSSFAIVVAGRALQGLCAAILPLSIGILRESLPESRVPVAVGLMSTAAGVGVAMGLILGGAIIDHFDWHWLFVASAVLLAVSIGAVSLLVPTKPGTPPSQPIDWIEGLLPTPGIMALLLGISLSKQYGWHDPRIVGLLAIGLIILGLWVRRSLAAREPFIDLRMLVRRDVAVGNGLGVLLALGTTHIVMVFSAFVQSPQWTGVGLGLGAAMAGLAKLPSNFLSFFAGPLSGLLTQKFGNRLPVLIGGALAGTGWLAGMLMPGTLIQVILLLCWISFGTTLLNAAIPNIIVGAVPQSRTSEAIGTLSVIRGMATAVGAQIIALILATDTIAAPGGTAHFPTTTGYRITMGWIGALTLFGGVCAFLLQSRRQAQGAAAAAAKSAGS